MRGIEIFYANGIFTVPTGVSYVTVEAWGAGGNGGFSTRFGGRGGGGSGGAYAKKQNYFVNEGQGYTVTVGQGGFGTNRDSWFDNINVVLAVGGIDGNVAQGGTVYATGASASIAGCVGDVIFKGGNGGNGRDAGSGGGGGGAGSIENGGNASTNTGGTGGGIYTYIPNAYGGGNGANGVSPGNSGNVGGNFGAGGSGGANTDLGFSTRQGGAGGNGVVVVTYSDQPLSPTIYSSCCDLEIGCVIYIDPELSITADAGTYYDGTNCFTVASNGTISSYGSCTPTQHCLGYYDIPPLYTGTCEMACDAYDLYTSCLTNIYIWANQTGSFKYTTCTGTVSIGIIPSNTPTASYSPEFDAYLYHFTGSCIRFNTITTDGIVPPVQAPADIIEVDYFISSSVCGTNTECGC